MITVNLSEDAEKMKLSVEIRGHAGYGDAGQDIICAAVSILAHTLSDLFRVYRCRGDTEILLPGIADLSVTCRCDRDYRLAKSYFDFAERGFRLLSASYPDYVTVSKKT